MRMSTFPAILFFILFITGAALAQTTGSIRGVVTDPEGQPMPGVAVTIQSTSLIGSTKTTYTNELGVFRFPSLPVGLYTVEAQLEGFTTVKSENVRVSLNATASVPMTMKGALAETISVTGEAPLIDPTKSGMSTTYSNELVKELPTQRQMWDLMQQAPGVTADVGDTQSSSVIAFGSNRQSNSWNIDGVNVTSPETGQAWWYINPDTIEEIEVMSVAAPAEFGGFSGAALNVVTKKGGNNFHGGASYFLQTDSLTGTNVELPDSPDVFHRDKYFDIAAQLGGPIAKDRIWFFGGIEFLRDAYTNPGVPADSYAPPLISDKYDFKVTGKLGKNHELSGFYHNELYHYTDAPSRFVAPTAIGDENGSNPAWGATLNSTLGNNFLLEFNYAGWWSDEVYVSANGDTSTPFIDYNDGTAPETYSGSLLYPFDYTTSRHQVNAKATYYAEDFLKSQHEFRFGVQYSRGSADTIAALGPDGFYQTSYNYYGYTYQYQYQQVPYHYGGVSNDLGLFIDDTVTVNKRLTMNLGVRFDHNRGSFPDYHRLGIGTPSISEIGNVIDTGQTVTGIDDFIRWDVFSPRIGLTWQARDDGKSVIRGSFGVYYDANVIGNWDSPPPEKPLYQELLFNPETGEYEPYDEETSLNFAYSKDIRPPRTLQYSAGFQQQIGSNSSFDAEYVYKDTKDLIGWNITGGAFQPVPFVDPFTGQQYILWNELVKPLLQKGNDPGNFPGSAGLKYFQKYHGVVLSFNRRFSNRFSLNTSYTWSKSEGLLPRMLSQLQFAPFYGNREGSDINHYINAEGRLQGDRPHMFRAQTIFSRLPWDLQISAAFDFSSGRAHSRQITVRDLLNQGSVDVIMEPTGSHRYSPVQNIDLSFAKRFVIKNAVTLRLDGTIFNLLNSDQELSFATLSLQHPTEPFVADSWTKPRRLQVRLGFEF